MSDESYERPPQEPGQPDGEIHPPAGGPEHRQEADDELEIIFYDGVGAPEDEQVAAPEPTAVSWEDEVRILLPAWSETTISSRTVPPQPVLSQPEKRISRRGGCFFAAIASVIVFSLLASSLFSIYWLWNQRSERAAELSALLNSAAEFPASSEADSRPAVEDEGMGEQPLVPALAPVAGERVNRIVFVNENRQIETISPDGDDRRQLTSDAKSYIFPAWSEDGRYIAAIGTNVSGAGIYVMPDEQDSGAVDEIHFSGVDTPFYLYWSPDGHQVTFLANDHATDLSLNIVDMDGDNESRKIALGSPMYWNWSADSRQMLVHSGSDTADAQLVLMDEFGRQLMPQVPAPGRFQAPGISHSGRYWAYSQYQAGGTTWLVVDDRSQGDGHSLRHAGAVAFTWSPNKDELAFISGSADVEFGAWGPLRVIDAETGEVRLLSAETVLAFFWSPDGRKIATISAPSQKDFGQQFEVRNEKGRRLARVAGPQSVQRVAQITPHTFRVNVIDVQSGEGLQLLETSLSAVFMAQFLPYFDQYAFSHHIWSPDSNSLVLPLAEGRQSRISLVDARNGRVTPLADGSIGFWSAR